MWCEGGRAGRRILVVTGSREGVCAVRGSTDGNRVGVTSRIMTVVTTLTTARIRNITSVTKGVAGRLVKGLKVGGLSGNIGISMLRNVIAMSLTLGLGCGCDVIRISTEIRRGIGGTVRGVAKLRITSIGVGITKIRVRDRRWGQAKGRSTGVIEGRLHRRVFGVLFRVRFGSPRRVPRRVRCCFSALRSTTSGSGRCVGEGCTTMLRGARRVSRLVGTGTGK